ncbi:hypothetical protein SR882_08545 [Guyparkeria halophila]|uniref:Uncharacterized protein n=1 Tax=Guyparkeria halophila TaxID=47960 RepID=A0ABZ0YUF2_9GAMM|nr:hypothetical protein [Guyparkeria halophila]WQH15805.1 hypothetical protein SR882_08545 [Guyparkeria halophila]
MDDALTRGALAPSRGISLISIFLVWLSDGHSAGWHCRHARRVRRPVCVGSQQSRAPIIDVMQADGSRTLLYIDLNMVRADQAAHPVEWEACGYLKILSPPCRYRVIDSQTLQQTLGIDGSAQLRTARPAWVEQALAEDRMQRDS